MFKLIILCMFIFDAYAMNWWKTADQKAYAAYQNKQYQEAMALFKRADWRGVAAFRQKNYAQAIQSFAEITTPDGFYNLGTALAFQGDYENAIQVYRKVLSMSPEHADAKYNLSILEKMQRQKEKEKQKQQQNQQNKKEQQQKEQDQKEENQNQQKEQEKKSKEQEKSKKDESSSDQKRKQGQQQPDKKSASKPKNAQEGQWLKLIEDDPAGLLKQKFLRDYQREVDEGKA